MRGRARWLVVLIGALLLVGALPAVAGATSPPSEPKTEPVEFTAAGVKLKGTLNPEGSPTYYHFAYIQAGALECMDIEGGLIEDCWERTPREGPLAGSGPQEVSAEVSGLAPGVYLYRLVAENEGGSRSSFVGRFTVPTPPAAQAPSVESERASHVTSTDARLEATINPEDAERGAYYQFQLVADPSEYLSTFACPAEWTTSSPFCKLSELDDEVEGLPVGRTFPGVEGQPVSLDLAKAGVTLKPGTTYHFRVIAARVRPTEEGPGWEGKIIEGPDQIFTTPPEGKAPVIESVKVTHLTKTDATLEATIDTEGLETEYAFTMSSSPCSKKGAGCELIVPVRLPCCGNLFGSFLAQTVSLDLNSAGVELGEGEYNFGVKAWNGAGNALASGGVFEASQEPVVEPLPSTVTPSPTSGGPAPSSGTSTGATVGSTTTTGGAVSDTASTAPKHGVSAFGPSKPGKHHHKPKHHTKAAKHPKHAEKGKHKK
jgi:hypothetical protein